VAWAARPAHRHTLAAMTLTTALLLGVAAVLVGFAKTAIGGVGSLAVAIFAVVLPTKESTAAILLLLIVGDVVATWHYRRDADLAMLRRLIPSVLPGLALGALFLAWVDDTTLRRSIGVLLLLLAALQIGLRWRSPDTTWIGRSRPAALGTGVAAGFATMTANAAGPVMTLYLVAQGASKRRFLGTNAVFFLGVNLCKVPFSIGLGLFVGPTLWRTAALAPLVLLGCWLGLHAARRLSQLRFDQAVLVATVVSALALVVR
jgi:uncharacterized membrane protein YfcA